LENRNYPPTASLWKHPIPFLVQGNLCPCFFSSAAVAVVVVAIPIDINLYNSTLIPINLASLDGSWEHEAQNIMNEEKKKAPT
jgi:hypothetical protein